MGTNEFDKKNIPIAINFKWFISRVISFQELLAISYVEIWEKWSSIIMQVITIDDVTGVTCYEYLYLATARKI